MMFIVVKWSVLPEHADGWLDTVDEFTQATRSELGNLFFEWSRSVEDPNVYVLVEAFRDTDAGGEHVRSEHFRTATGRLGDYLQSTPSIVSTEIAGMTGWGEMGEITVER
jgi:quinol monooxygenase YgiN